MGRGDGLDRLEDLGGSRSRHFRETYEAFNPIARLLLERRVHRSISKDNDRFMKSAIERGIQAARRQNSSGKPNRIT